MDIGTAKTLKQALKNGIRLYETLDQPYSESDLIEILRQTVMEYARNRLQPIILAAGEEKMVEKYVNKFIESFD